MSKSKKIKNRIPYSYLWTKENPMSFITESYQKLLANIEYVNVDKKFKVIQVTSSLSSEGKSTFLSNLAFLLGQKGKKTILVDLDLRKPKVHRIYDVENKFGITDVLAERVLLDESIKSSKTLPFDTITSGEKTNAVVNLLESEKMKNLISELRKKYDYVLLDSPPVIEVSDALYISKLSDACIFIISMNKTRRGIVNEAIKVLRRNNTNLIGTVLTQVDMKKSRYGYGYGYGYGCTYTKNN